MENVEDNPDAAQAQELMRRCSESVLTQKPKTERKGGGTQVAFGFAGSSTSQGGSSSTSQGPPTGGGTDNKPKKEYKEPWDYYSNYPTILPMRRPYSGDPNVLDEEEFGEDAAYDENSTKPAVELGLMEENMEERMLLFQLPSKLPMWKEQPKASDSKEASKSAGNRQEACNLHELPEVLHGKLLVYKSGAVKMKLGDNLFDVNDGVEISCSSEVVAVNKNQKVCCSAELQKGLAAVTLDVNDILDSKRDD